VFVPDACNTFPLPTAILPVRLLVEEFDTAASCGFRYLSS
jgi:hypothetical protein